MKSLIKISITMLCLAVIIAVALPVHAKKDDKDGDKDKDSDTDTQTIYQVLQHTNGSEALFAAILFNDECFENSRHGDNPGCDTEIKELLDDKKKDLVLFALSNRGFESILQLPEGWIDASGMDAEGLKVALPELLLRLELADGGPAEKAIYELLIRHIVPTKDAKKKAAEKLLQQGSITVGIGGHVTEHEVRAINGLIHYIDNVLVEPIPVPEEPVDEYDVADIEEFCIEIPGCFGRENRCEEAVWNCFLAEGEQDPQTCGNAGFLACLDLDLRGPPGGLF